MVQSAFCDCCRKHKCMLAAGACMVVAQGGSALFTVLCVCYRCLHQLGAALHLHGETEWIYIMFCDCCRIHACAYMHAGAALHLQGEMELSQSALYMHAYTCMLAAVTCMVVAQGSCALCTVLRVQQHCRYQLGTALHLHAQRDGWDASRLRTEWPEVRPQAGATRRT